MKRLSTDSPVPAIPLLITGLLALPATGCKPTGSSGGSFPEKPNIVLIIADDLAWDDCGAYGNTKVSTPNIDLLARQGMKFNQAFLTAPSCSPSRSSIITGLYPHNTDAEQLHWPLPAGKLTFVELLKASGYYTAQAGKWHLGDAVKDRFDLVCETGTEGFQLAPDGAQSALHGDGSGCERWVQTLRERPPDKPFFLWLAAVDPHRPYSDSIIAKPHSPHVVTVPPYLPDVPAVRTDLALYYDEIARLDAYVGNVMNELERQEIVHNTLVLFISDNGRAFPRDKTTLYDGGIKTPWIIRWPDAVQAGQVCNQLVSAVDIAPTFLRLAGLDVPGSFEGTDFSPLLLNPESPVREWIYAEDHWHDVEDYTRAVRTVEFKYIRNFYTDLPNTPPADALRSLTFQAMRKLRDAGSLTTAQMRCFEVPRPEEELYELQNDPFELNNLAGKPEADTLLTSLRKRMDEIRSETNDRLPAFRTPDEFDRETGEPNQYRIRPRPSKAEMQPEIMH
jgi:arylsulfatase A-like enzyme